MVVAAVVGGIALTGTAAAAENLHDGSVTDPSTGETVYAVNSSEKKSLTYGYVVENVTNTGESVEIFLEFDDKLNNTAGDNRLSSFSGNVTCICGGSPESVSVASSPSIVDGPDGDGIKETVKIGVQPSKRDQPIDLIVNFTGDVTWSEETSNVKYPVKGAVIEPNQDVPPTQFESVTVAGGLYTETNGSDVRVTETGTQRSLSAHVWNAPSNSKLQFTYWEEGSKSSTQVVTSNQTVSGTGTFSQDIGVDSANTNYVFKSCVYNDDTGESNEGPELTFESGTGESTTPTGSEGGCGSIDPVTDGSSGSDGTGDTTSDDAPQISNYEVTSDGDEITVAFDSDENLVDIEADVRGPDSGTLTREDFSGDRFAGFEATYVAGTDGDYTVELVTAEDSSGNDGAQGEDFTDSTTVESTNESTDGSTDSSGDSTDDSSSDSSGDSTDDSSSDSSGDSTDDSSSDSSSDSTDDSSSDSSGDSTDDSSSDSTDDSSGDSSGDASNDSTDDSTGESSDDGDDTGGSDDGMDATESPTESDGPGLGPVVAVTALLAVALLFYRRR